MTVLQLWETFRIAIIVLNVFRKSSWSCWLFPILCLLLTSLFISLHFMFLQQNIKIHKNSSVACSCFTSCVCYIKNIFWKYLPSHWFIFFFSFKCWSYLTCRTHLMWVERCDKRHKRFTIPPKYPHPSLDGNTSTISVYLCRSIYRSHSRPAGGDKPPIKLRQTGKSKRGREVWFYFVFSRTING